MVSFCLPEHLREKEAFWTNLGVAPVCCGSLWTTQLCVDSGLKQRTCFVIHIPCLKVHVKVHEWLFFCFSYWDSNPQCVKPMLLPDRIRCTLKVKVKAEGQLAQWAIHNTFQVKELLSTLRKLVIKPSILRLMCRCRWPPHVGHLLACRPGAMCTCMESKVISFGTQLSNSVHVLLA